MYRIGQSRDIHKFGENRKLVLGTIEIPYQLGLIGHSDADALVHSIVEAIIGALGLGDLGTIFPDTDKKYKDISSSYFLTQAKELLKKYKYEIINIDSTILIEEPMMSPFIKQMKQSIAYYLGCDENKINIKATRGETLGFVGEKKGVEADTVVLLKEAKKLKKI